jgi:hypothetical protein
MPSQSPDAHGGIIRYGRASGKGPYSPDVAALGYGGHHTDCPTKPGIRQVRGNLGKGKQRECSLRQSRMGDCQCIVNKDLIIEEQNV